ncbi:MAG: response regulator transcription factor [Acidobacteriaceae bacterium]
MILADNQSVFRTGAARILAVEEDCRIVGQCDDLPRLIKAVSCFPNSVILFAASLRPETGALVRLARESGSTTIAILENDEGPQDYVRVGVRGIVHRDITNHELVRSVRAIGRGEVYVQKRSTEAAGEFESNTVAERVRERLTPKELKIVGLILQGYKNRDIAEELHNSEQVIKNYLRSIFDKTGVSDRLELALFAMHHKILGSQALRTKNEHAATAELQAIN